MDLKDHKNIQTEQTQDAQSLFSPSHLLPACNHRPRVSRLARFNTPRSNLSQKKTKKTHLLSTICWWGRVLETVWSTLTRLLLNRVESKWLRWRVFVQDACVCSSALRLWQEILLHSSYPTALTSVGMIDTQSPGRGGRMRVKPVERWREKDVEEANLKQCLCPCVSGAEDISSS